jgi:hypothetical protein
LFATVTTHLVVSLLNVICCGVNFTTETVSGSMMTLAAKSIVSDALVESLQVILAFLVILPFDVLVPKINSTTVESPGANAFFWIGAEVHPQPGLTSIILKVSSPMFLIQ